MRFSCGSPHHVITTPSPLSSRPKLSANGSWTFAVTIANRGWQRPGFQRFNPLWGAKTLLVWCFPFARRLSAEGKFCIEFFLVREKKQNVDLKSVCSERNVVGVNVFSCNCCWSSFSHLNHSHSFGHDFRIISSTMTCTLQQENFSKYNPTIHRLQKHCFSPFFSPHFQDVSRRFKTDDGKKTELRQLWIGFFNFDHRLRRALSTSNNSLVFFLLGHPLRYEKHDDVSQLDKNLINMIHVYSTHKLVDRQIANTESHNLYATSPQNCHSHTTCTHNALIVMLAHSPIFPLLGLFFLRPLVSAMWLYFPKKD